MTVQLYETISDDFCGVFDLHFLLQSPHSSGSPVFLWVLLAKIDFIEFSVTFFFTIATEDHRGPENLHFITFFQMVSPYLTEMQ